ncbi:PREDICTED: helicase protein MOM1-like isoform X2 [Nelumbo nucifera]|uniref:Helicase protein MOM1-like isoform X2 n=1 Tax=Nelumbo nucifera TaxID=4432 RepID=A0A1U8AJZ9_NELNU|nr:PREDICTED: helicase protein MOM1-like isoform X2 [Nelumbo nucifera]
MVNDTRPRRKIKDGDSNNSKRGEIGAKGSTASGSATTDTSGLRRSTRELPSKKKTLSSPSNTRKSERLEKQTPSTPLKKKSERVEKKKMPCPLKKSERSEKQRSLSSSESKRHAKGLSTSDTKSKKRKGEKSRKQQALDVREQNRSEKQDSKSTHVVLKKKRLDARSYRALLSSKTKMAKETDLGEKLRRQDKLSQGDSNRTGTSDSKEVEDVAEQYNDENGEELRREDIVGGCESSAQESNYDLRKFPKGTSRYHKKGELSSFIRKRKIHPEEVQKSENGDGSPESKYSGSSLQSSPNEIVGKEIVDDGKSVHMENSSGEDLQNQELIESTSEGRSLTSEADGGRTDKLGSVKRKRNAMNMDSDAYASGASKEICCSTADTVSSSQPGSKRNCTFEKCSVCSKRQRLDNDAQSWEVCSCKEKEVSAQLETLTSPQVVEPVLSPIPKDRDDGVNEDTNINLGEHLPVVQREIGHGSSGLHTEVEILVPPKDRGEPEGRVGTRCIEEVSIDTQQDQFPLGFQTDSDDNACVICKLGGKLLCCDGKGCKRNFHLMCLDPPLKDVPAGNWHCISCVKKKIEYGVHAVSDGVESIWDAREVDISDNDGLQRQKQYLVKYKGLAHVHNRWVSESELILEAPMLVAKFNRKNQCVRWKPEWVVPHRLLRKRLLMSQKQRSEYIHKGGIEISDCYYEWFVKWAGLGYEHATWELENEPFLKTHEAMALIGNYHMRRKKAKRASDPSRTDEVPHERKGSFVKLSRLPSGVPTGLGDSYLNYVNKLCEYWHKGHNAVAIDDQERVMKVILFILSLQSDVHRPFLIITTPTALSVWEAEFLRLAPCFNVVVYNGSKDIRKSIQSLEFYEEGGCIMFQALLSLPEDIVEDLEALECLEWEAIIVDECQQIRVSKHMEQIKMLTTDFRLLVASGQDSIAEYLNLLSFLDPGSEEINSDSLKTDSIDNMSKLKKRLAQFVAFEHKSDSSKFIEYWVPIHLSNVQLEQYCATLLANSMSLRSNSKSDPVGALREIVISVRKCCDHPYLVDQSLQTFLTRGLPEIEYLDVGVKASGKLQLLDRILSEIKGRGLRVLILFQSIGGSGRNSIGDILDDFLRQRFGADSYERVDSGLLSSKRQAALNIFNNKEQGRFVFLLENRACHPSIKLCSVDTVILFGSDWNPLNDLRALQRISIDSQFEQLKVFRLYSCCTVEEKVLILSKQDMTLDINVQNINRSTSHMLLIWGASYLFKKLDEFHGCTTLASESNVSFEQSIMNDVVGELLKLLPCDNEDNETSNCSIIAKVQQSGTTYSVDSTLPGESERQLFDESSHVFWAKILERKEPQWRYSSRPTQRIRKKVQYFEESPKKAEVESDEITKKRKKVINNMIDPILLRPWVEDKRKETPVGKKEMTTIQCGSGSQVLQQSAINMNSASHIMHDLSKIANDTTKVPEVQPSESDEGRTLRDSQKSLHLLLKPEISKLCEILHFPEDVKGVAARFLEYIMNNHHVPREPATILQAFQISLCWTAASLLRHKIDHKDSLERAKQIMNFYCKEEEAEHVYPKLRVLGKIYSSREDNVKKSNSTKDNIPRTKDVGESVLPVRASQSIASDQQELEEGEIRESSHSSDFNQQVSTKKGYASDSEKANESLSNDFSNDTIKVEKIFAERIKMLLRKQQEEVQKFNKIKEKQKEDLEKEYKLEAALIRTINTNIAARLDKLKILDVDFSRKMKEFIRLMEVHQKKLENLQLAARNEEKQMKAHWLEDARSGRPIEAVAKLPFPDTGFSFIQMETSGPDVLVMSDGVIPSETTEIVQNQVDRGSIPMETSIPEVQSSGLDVPLVPGGVVLPEVLETVAFEEDTARVTSEASTPAMLSSGLIVPVTPGRVAPPETTETVQNEADRCDIIAETLSPSVQSSALDVLETQGGVQPLEILEVVQDEVDKGSGNVPIETLTPSMQFMGPEVPEVPGGVIPPRAAESAPNEVDEGIIPMEMVIPMQASGVDGEKDNLASEREDLAEFQQQTMTDSPNDREISSAELTQIDIPSSAQTHIPSAQDNTLPSHQVLSIEHPEPPISTGLQIDGPSNSAVWSPPQQVEVPLNTEDAVPPEQSNHDNLAVAPAVQLQLPQSTDPASEHNQPNVAAVTGKQHSQSNERGTSSEPDQSQIKNPAEPPNHSVPQPSQSLLQPPTETPLGRSGSHVSDPRSMGICPESSSCSQILPSGGSGIHVSDTRSTTTAPESSSRPPQTTLISRMPQNWSPLQDELERLCKEEEQAIKKHEDVKLWLQFQRDKEIEEINKKYATKLHEVETAMVRKRKELEVNYNKVYMNLVLAETFRTQYSGRQGAQQGVSSSFIQQLLFLSGQQQVPRPTITAGSSAAAPGHVVHHSSALFSSNPARSHFSSIVPTTGNLQAGTEQRAPAPHLQSCRPSVSMSIPNSPVPRPMPSHQFLATPAATPSLAANLTSGVCAMPNQQQSLGNPSATSSIQHLFPQLPINAVGHFSRSHQPDAAGGSPLLVDTSMPSRDHLMDIDNHQIANPSQLLQTCQETLSTRGTSELATGGTVQGAGTGNCMMADVVYLSDDD